MTLRETTEKHRVELRVALAQMSAQPEALSSERRESLLAKVRRGDIIVIDVRPALKYEVGYLSAARSFCSHPHNGTDPVHSTVTLFARLRGLSTSVPFTRAAWYDSNCSGITCSTGDSMP